MKNKQQMIAALNEYFRNAQKHWDFLREISRRVIEKYHDVQDEDVSSFQINLSLKEEISFWDDISGTMKKFVQLLEKIGIENDGITLEDSGVMKIDMKKKQTA